jgi:tetratricopeptide (TPR) repeat protein
MNQNVDMYKTTNDTFVVGRNSFFNRIVSLVTSSEENGAFLFAQRGFGKTSAITGLCAYLTSLNIHNPIYIDPLSFKDHSLETILIEMMAQSFQKMSIPLVLFDNPINDFENIFLPKIREHLKPEHRLIICMDEFDVSEQSKDHMASHFYLWLKCIETKLQGELFIILTGGRRPVDLIDIYLPYFNHFRLLCLHPMNFLETFALVRHTERNNSIQWPEKIVKQIQMFSGGHPVLIESISRELRHLPYGASPEETFSGVMMRFEKNMKWIWDGLSTDEKIVAACLSESHSCMTKWQIEKRLDQTRTSLFYDRLKTALQNLETWGIIESRSEGYAVRCKFLLEWIQKKHPIQSILKDVEDLPQVSDFLYQAAYRLFQTNRIEDAIQVGQHIIQIYPEHIEANQMVADILITQDHCIEAQKILEQLYKNNPESAKTRLVNALTIQASALEALYAYSVNDYRHTPINSHLRNIKLRYSEKKDQNNHLLIVYEKILALAPDCKEIHDKYIALILHHQKINDYKRKISYEKDVLIHELNAYLLTEATSKVKQLQNRILFSQIYLKALNTLLAKEHQKATDLFVRVVYMDEKCKDARRFLYISKHYSPEVERAIEESIAIPSPSKNSTTEESEDMDSDADQTTGRTRQKNNLMLWIFLIILIIVAAYVMMDGTLK